MHGFTKISKCPPCQSKGQSSKNMKNMVTYKLPPKCSKKDLRAANEINKQHLKIQFYGLFDRSHVLHIMGMLDRMPKIKESLAQRTTAVTAVVV